MSKVWYIFRGFCIPFMKPIDTEPGFPQALFSQIRPIGQSISLLHWTEMSSTSSMSWKFGPIWIKELMAINIYYLLIVKIKLQEACTVKDVPLLVVAMPKRQKTMSRTIAIAGLSVPIYENNEEPKKKY